MDPANCCFYSHYWCVVREIVPIDLVLTGNGLEQQPLLKLEALLFLIICMLLWRVVLLQKSLAHPGELAVDEMLHAWILLFELSVCVEAEEALNAHYCGFGYIARLLCRTGEWRIYCTGGGRQIWDYRWRNRNSEVVYILVLQINGVLWSSADSEIYAVHLLWRD